MPHNETLLFVFFTIFICGLLALDLGVFNKRPHAIGTKEALYWSMFWIALSLLFNVGVFIFAGSTSGLEFLTGYLIEKALSVDNIFVFIVIFSYFGIPPKFQHKVLFWGVVGALIMRGIFIALGAALIGRFEWIIYVFGLILLYSGWKLLGHKEVEVHPDRNIFIRLARRFFPVDQGFDEPRFLVRKQGRIHITPFLLVLITVETTDVVFAVDSIPAVFGVTRDPFIVYSSNIFAILGLRALYFLLAGAMQKLEYLSTGLSLVLIFVGLKMLTKDLFHVPIIV
ncbi:MAG: TerC family protein, partial [Bacteroidetes bacterium]|nr:TerC family protein [Bacteroidota bacterium]